MSYNYEEKTYFHYSSFIYIYSAIIWRIAGYISEIELVF